MELTDSTHPNLDSTRSIHLNHAAAPTSSSSSSQTLPPDPVALVKTFHEHLPPSAGAPACLPPADSRASDCRSCDRPGLGDDSRCPMVVCDGCDRGFHLGCAGMSEQQSQTVDDWICGDCVANQVPSNRWPLGSNSKRMTNRKRKREFLDTTDLPLIIDGEGQRSEHSPESSKHAPGENSFGRNPFDAPDMHSNFFHAGNGFSFGEAPGTVKQNLPLESKDTLHCMQPVHSDFDEVNSCSLLEELRNSNNTASRLSHQAMSEMHLQVLRDYVHERYGVLEEGWRVELKESRSSGEVPVIYCAPDGMTFESLSQVACYLGLLANNSSAEAKTRSDGSASLEGLQSCLPPRRKSVRLAGRFGIAKSKETPPIATCKEQPSEVPNRGIANKVANCTNVTQGGVDDNCETELHPFNDGLPVQYEDFLVLSVGKVDQRPSYHDVNQIWPVGYRSSWHDKITGSLFICEVCDGGDSGPIFQVQRFSCSALPMLKGSTVLCKPNIGLSGCLSEENSMGMSSNNLDHDEDSVLMILSELSPPMEHDVLSCLDKTHDEAFTVQKTTGLQPGTSAPCEGSSEISFDISALGDEIGEFSFEESSSFSAWEKVTEKIIHACHEIYTKTGSLKFFCKHVANGSCSRSSDIAFEKREKNFVSLAKYSGLPDSFDVPYASQGGVELGTVSRELLKWLIPDRFGLDVEFVQEILEQLPGVQVCPNYVFLSKRSHYSSFATVGNGVLQVKTNGVEATNEVDNLFGGCKRSSTLMIEDAAVNNYCLPPGKPINCCLPPQLVGDVLQVWEFLCRFNSVLGLKEIFSIEVLEQELINPCVDYMDLLENFGKESLENQYMNIGKTDSASGRSLFSNTVSGPVLLKENSHDFIQLQMGGEKEAARVASVSKCTGSKLSKVHISMLKVLIGELQYKVASVLDLNFDHTELKSRRGRKKDADFLIATKRTKVNMLPLNELTWPELARRYVLAVLTTDGNLDSVEIICKVFNCLQGDGGVLCGALTGVAGIEADALLLSDATRKIFGSLNRENDVLVIYDGGSDGTNSCSGALENVGIMPEWAQALEPVRKLPTNVGARIKKCINEALEKNPPEWAKKILLHSISKDVYKGNASGPTKKAVVSVLADMQNLQQAPVREKKPKRLISISGIIIRKCRIVLRRVAAADGSKVFCNLLARRPLNSIDDEGIFGSPATFSRPLDLRTIDLRLAAGAYGGSHEAFFEDVSELFKNMHIAYGNQPDLVQLAETLSSHFEKLYKEEVLFLLQKLLEYAKLDHLSAESEEELDNLLDSVNDIPKAPWEEGLCKVCGIDKDDNNVLLCDNCDSEYHIYCLKPPLANIPPGNWYCPSCKGNKEMVEDITEGSQVKCRCQKKYLEECTCRYLDALTCLAAEMGEREYWEFSVEERTFLLKFLSDELLNSALVRHHLEQCTDKSAELQQKMRSLLSQGKTLKDKERSLALKAGQHVPSIGTRSFNQQLYLSDGSNYFSASFDGCSHLDSGHNWNSTTESTACSPDQKLENSSINCHIVGDIDQSDSAQGVSENGELYHGSSCHLNSSGTDESIEQKGLFWSCNSRKEFNEMGGDHEFNEVGGDYEFQSKKITDAGKDVLDLFGSEKSGEIHSPPGARSTCTYKHASTAEVESQSSMLELKSVKNEIFLLQESMKNMQREVLKLSARREFLGRDSAGRLYWVLAKSGTHPYLVLHGNLSSQQRGKTEQPYLSAFTPCSLGNSGVSCPNFQDCGVPESICSPWVSYHTDSDIKQLVDCMRDNDPREKELKESILQWRKLVVQDFPHFKDKGLDDGSRYTYGDSCLSTKAYSFLETKYGPCFHPETTGFLKNQNRRAKLTSKEKFYRCDCLELVWPSRYHCASCHKTFYRIIELHRHKCIFVTSNSEKNKEINAKYNFFKLKCIAESNFEWEEFMEERNISDASKSGGSEITQGVIRYQNDGLIGPFDFRQICSKFEMDNSNKKLVQQIGLIGSNGNPSFVSSTSLYLGDPTLMLVSLPEYDGLQVDKTKADTMPTNSQGFVATSAIHDDIHAENFSPRHEKNDFDEALHRVAPEHSEYKGKNLSIPAPAVDVDMCCVVPESSFKPLFGMAAHILRQLKINLLDMDAVLPKEALRSSKAQVERRWAWRAFLKSAETIYEMVQAIIALEDMIRTDYLRNTWWYWSSFSVAAKISTLSSLALRIYSLDAAINYDKISYSCEPRPMSDPKQQLSLDSTEKNKLGGKANNKRKEPET